MKGIVDLPKEMNMNDLFQEWTLNRNIKISFASYVKYCLNNGVYINDLEKYNNLLKGGNHKKAFGGQK
jgi:hypothetical protein